MDADCPVNDLNLSFSGEESDGGMYLTQNSFSNVNTQDVNNAVEYFNDFDEMKFDDKSGIKVDEVSEDAMCSAVFDFSEEHDNGWTVSTQDNPTIVTRNSDGQQFVIGDNEKVTSVEESKFHLNDVLPPIHGDLDEDLKRFSSIVTAVELDDSKRKRCVFLNFALSFSNFVNFY